MTREKPKDVLIELSPQHQMMLGVIRLAMGKHGNPISMAAAIRAAIEYMSESLQTSAANGDQAKSL